VGVADEELDFIYSARLRTGINYDNNCWMGRKAENAEE
jgi:hypothetical protein